MLPSDLDHASGLGTGSEFEHCREAALRILDRTAQSQAQLREKLLRRGFAESVVTEVLERFVAVGLVDDAEYAACLVRARFNERGLARRGIAAELQRKGVSSEVASRALQQIDDDSQFSAAVTVAHKSLAHTEKQETSVRTRRAVAKLARLGYPSETAFSAVRQALAEMS